MAIRFNLRITNVHRGLLLGTGPLVDPGFEGDLLIPIHNLTNNSYYFKGGDKFIWVEFTKVSSHRDWGQAVDRVAGQSGIYEPIPKDKIFRTPKQYFENAYNNAPIKKATPAALDHAEKLAKRLAIQVNVITFGGVSIAAGLILAGVYVLLPLAQDSVTLRVRPETLCRITEFSEHESNGRELDEGERVAVEVLPVLGQSAAAVEPGDGAFDHPTPGLDDEALHPIGSLDDLGLEIGQDAGQGAVKDRPLIGAVGEQFPEKGKQTEQGRQQRETAVAILNVGGGDDAVQQQALRIDQNMPLLALDQLAGIEAVAVDASPPFSALFTL